MSESEAIELPNHREQRWLAYTVAFDQPGLSHQRQMAKLLTGSLLRTLFGGEILVLRNTPDPLYLIPRAGVHEIYIETPPGLFGNDMLDYACTIKYRARHWICTRDEKGAPLCPYDKVLFLDADSLVLRNLDHLCQADGELWYAEEKGVPWTQPQFSTFIEDELLQRQPHRYGINSGTWMVNGSRYMELMEAWEAIDQGPAARKRVFSEQGAWNRLLFDTVSPDGLRRIDPIQARRFEGRDIRFPLHLHGNFKDYRNGSILHFLGGTQDEKLQMMFGLYMAWFFWDKSGMFLDLLES